MSEVWNPAQIEERIRDVSNRIADGVGVCNKRYKAFLDEDRALDAAFALTHLGVPMDRIHRALNMAHRDVRAVILAHGMVPVKSAQEQFSWTALAWRSKRRRRAAA